MQRQRSLQSRTTPSPVRTDLFWQTVPIIYALGTSPKSLQFEQIAQLVGDTPFIDRINARHLYDLILRDRCTKVLELGIAHGTATCYIAAAIEELGGGKVTAVDLADAKAKFEPSAEQQLSSTGLDRYAEIVRMQSGYNWFLHDEIASQTKDDVCRAKYDLCIIDGPKNWTIDSSAFFLVDKLLLPGGWIILDDYHWSYSKAEKKRDQTDGITHRTMSAVERRTPQIADIFELLVKQHPDYGNLTLWEDADWALAQKVCQQEKTYTIVHRTEISDVFGRWVSKQCRRWRDYRHSRRR